MSTGMSRILAFILAVLLPAAAASAEPAGGLYSYRLLEDGSAVITGYKGSETDPVFPDTLDGHPVTGLSGNFSANTPSIRSLISITLPETLTDIGPGALQFAGYLEEIRIAGDSPALAFADGALYDAEKQRLIVYLPGTAAQHFDVPEGVRELADRAFFRARLTSVRLPESLERIGSECFDLCSVLRDLSLPRSLKSIGPDAFANCDKLKRITIPAGVTEIGESPFTDNRLTEILVDPDNPVFTVSDGALINVRDGVAVAFPAKSEAESCTVPAGVTRIGRFAFYRCHNLKQISLPEGLLEIGRGAFVSCNHLTGIALPDSVTLLESAAFEGNSDAETLRLPAGLTEIAGNFNHSGYTKLEIPETVTSITDSFNSLPNLTEVVIPGSVGMLGGSSFAFCKNLAAVSLPAGLTEIGSTFPGCAKSLVFTVEAGSGAEQYCRDRGLDYRYAAE